MGLEESGKSALIKCLKPEKDKENDHVESTLAYKIETIKGKSRIDFTCMDMSGKLEHRSIWEKFYAKSEAIIFVVDAENESRFDEARIELEKLLEHKDVKNRSIPILFFATK